MTTKEIHTMKMIVVVIAAASIALMVVSLYLKQWILTAAMALCALGQIYNYRAWNKKEKELNKK